MGWAAVEQTERDGNAWRGAILPEGAEGWWRGEEGGSVLEEEAGDVLEGEGGEAGLAAVGAVRDEHAAPRRVVRHAPHRLAPRGAWGTHGDEGGHNTLAAGRGCGGPGLGVGK